MSRTRAKVILLANAYPYGDWEPYLGPEVQALAKKFDLSIISLSIRKDQFGLRRETPAGVAVLPLQLMPTLGYVLLGAGAVFSHEFWSEVKLAVKNRRDVLASIIYTAKVWTRSQWEARKIERFLRNNNLEVSDEFVIYAYRMEYQTYLATLLKRKFPKARIIVRGHGTDLEIEHRPGERVPFREIGFANADRLAVVSKYSLRYLQERYPQFSNKMAVSYLGTYDNGIAEWERQDSVIRLLSISNMTSIKRIPLIVDALQHTVQQCRDIKIEWTHFGSGRDMDLVRKRIQDLPSNIHVSLKGQVDNAELMEHLQDNPYDLLINTSSREGLPVSMMESMSLGIPVVGTPVGGVPEIVNDNVNGWLIDEHAISKSLANLLCCYAELPGSRKEQLRKNARQTWETSFSAEAAYSRFSQLIEDTLHE